MKNKVVLGFASRDYISTVDTAFSYDDLMSAFNKSEKVIQDGRNKIKLVSLCGKQVVVKSFKVPNPIQGFMYRFFRSSKALRSLIHTEYLLSKGINAPKPLAYIEVVSLFRLRESYYVCDYFEHDYEIRHVIQYPNLSSIVCHKKNELSKRVPELPLDDSKNISKQQVLQAVVEFTHRLHQANVLHLDYSPGNILVRKKEHGFEFGLVDINRMKIAPVSERSGAENFSRLSKKQQDIDFFAQAYSEKINLSLSQCELYLNQAVKKIETFRNRKRVFKKWVKRVK